jgi:metallophosphoesterase (TIGR00282 family)
MNILFIGDIVGRLGRQAVAKLLPKLKKKYKIDLVIANAENAAHGSGVTEKILKELKKSGIDAFTAGDHSFRNHKQLELFNNYPLLRPANFPKNAPGGEYLIIEKSKQKILLISLIGQVFMNNSVDNPFIKINEILADNSLQTNNFFAIIIDIHAETTSEKVNMGYHLDGRVSAVLGTHTHIMTADARITKKGTAYITDVGMAGAAYESLGISKKGTLKQFLSYIKEPHVLPEKGEAILNSVLLEIGRNQKAKSIKPISEFVKIS